MSILLELHADELLTPFVYIFGASTCLVVKEPDDSSKIYSGSY